MHVLRTFIITFSQWSGRREGEFSMKSWRQLEGAGSCIVDKSWKGGEGGGQFWPKTDGHQLWGVAKMKTWIYFYFVWLIVCSWILQLLVALSCISTMHVTF